MLENQTTLKEKNTELRKQVLSLKRQIQNQAYKSEVNKKLEKIMRENTALVIETAKKYKVSTRLGAYILSISRIAQKAKTELDQSHHTCFAKYL